MLMGEFKQEVLRINNKAINPADDLDQQDLPDVMAQRLTELDRRISRLEKDAQGGAVRISRFGTPRPDDD